MKVGVIRIAASVMLCITLVGCVGALPRSADSQTKYTLLDLKKRAKEDPLRKPAFPRQQEEVVVEPFDKEFLIGKWHRSLCTARKSWFVAGGRIHSTESRLYYDITYEFMSNGTYTCGGTISRKAVGVESDKTPTGDFGSWNYNPETSELVLVRGNKRDLVRTESKRTVVWFSADKISLREMDSEFVGAQASEDIQDMLHKKVQVNHNIDRWGCLHMTSEEDGNAPTYSEIFDTPDYWVRISPPPVVNKPSFKIVSLKYDSQTRIGHMSVRINADQYGEARKYIRRNIETLARDKNIALTTGEIPPAAKFYLGREELKDGNVLEIEFKTE